MAPRKRVNKAYLEKLQDPRWQKKRLEAFNRADWCCQCCGSNQKNLQVHHGYYDTKNLEPWDYPLESLFVVCRECHELAEAVRITVYREVGCIHPAHHAGLREIVSLVRKVIELGGAAGRDAAHDLLVQAIEAMEEYGVEEVSDCAVEKVPA